MLPRNVDNVLYVKDVSFRGNTYVGCIIQKKIHLVKTHYVYDYLQINVTGF